MGRNYGSTSNSNECTPLVSGSDSNGHPSVSSHSNANNGATTATVDNGGNSNNDLWEELDRPWPATFERAVSLLASPVLNRRDIQHYTSSPKPGSTPLALQRRRTLSKGFYSPSKDTAATILAQRRRQGFCDDTITNYIGQNDVDVEGGSFRTGDKHDSDRIVRMQEKIAQIKEKFEQRVDTTQSKLATQAQKAKEYRQQQLLKLQGTQDDGNQRHQPSMSAREREDMLRSPGYAKEVQSLRLQQQQKTQSAKGSAAGSATVWQSAFNLANILMGVGLLGLPFGFKVAGYWGGFVCVLVFGMITWRTSILIGRELNGDPRPSHAFDDNPFQSPYAPGTTRGRLLPPIAGFPDIARRSFGETGCLILSILLYFELFSCVCIFFVAIGDHLHSIFPTVPLEMLTILAATISLGPTIFLHTPRLLSYFSMVGTFATVAVVGTVVAAALLAGSRVEEIQSQQAAMTGHAVTESPYQGWGNVQGIIMCLGLVAYCFSGHAIVPSIYTSMKEPQRFEEMVTLTFVMVMLVCFAVVCILKHQNFTNNIFLDILTYMASALFPCLLVPLANRRVLDITCLAQQWLTKSRYPLKQPFTLVVPWIS